MTPDQCKAARVLLHWSQADLCKAAEVGITTVSQFEIGNQEPWPRTLAAMRQALEAAGVIFLEPDQLGGYGVRLAQ